MCSRPSPVTPPRDGPAQGTHTADAAGSALVIGKIHVQALVKLASAAGVVAVGPIEFAQTGSPAGDPDDEVGKQPDGKMDHVLEEFLKKEVPYSKAPPLRGSNFAALRRPGPARRQDP